MKTNLLNFPPCRDHKKKENLESYIKAAYKKYNEGVQHLNQILADDLKNPLFD